MTHLSISTCMNTYQTILVSSCKRFLVYFRKFSNKFSMIAYENNLYENSLTSFHFVRRKSFYISTYTISTYAITIYQKEPIITVVGD